MPSSQHYHMCSERVWKFADLLQISGEKRSRNNGMVKIVVQIAQDTLHKAQDVRRIIVRFTDNIVIT